MLLRVKSDMIHAQTKRLLPAHGLRVMRTRKRIKNPRPTSPEIRPAVRCTLYGVVAPKSMVILRVLALSRVFFISPLALIQAPII